MNNFEASETIHDRLMVRDRLYLFIDTEGVVSNANAQQLGALVAAALIKTHHDEYLVNVGLMKTLDKFRRGGEEHE